MTDADDDGTTPAPAPESPLAALHAEPVNPHGLGGYGPLVAAIVLAVLIVLLAPTIAPEHVVERPVTGSTNTTTTVVP